MRETKFPDCQGSANAKSPFFPWYTLIQFTLWRVKGVFLPPGLQWLAPCLFGLFHHQCWLGAGRFSAVWPLTAAIWQFHRAFWAEAKPNFSKLNLMTEIFVIFKKCRITTPQCCSRELAIISSQQGHRSCCLSHISTSCAIEVWLWNQVGLAPSDKVYHRGDTPGRFKGNYCLSRTDLCQEAQSLASLLVSLTWGNDSYGLW